MHETIKPGLTQPGCPVSDRGILEIACTNLISKYVPKMTKERGRAILVRDVFSDIYSAGSFEWSIPVEQEPVGDMCFDYIRANLFEQVHH